MLLSQQRITGIATILAVSLSNGDSPHAIHNRLEQAINGAFAPCSGWTNWEYDIAFLAKALSGSRLLYVLQKAEGYPSNTTLKRRRKIPEIIVSAGKPAEAEVDTNILAFLGENGWRLLQLRIIQTWVVIINSRIIFRELQKVL
jgi:hypothetical protein